MKIATMTVVLGGLVLPPVLSFLLLRRWTGRGWAPFAGALVALALGCYLVFFKIFPDTFRAKPAPAATVEVILPDRFEGFLYLFFDSRQQPLQPSAPGVYSVLVPPSGRLRAGQFPGQSVSQSNTILVLRYLNGEKAPVAEGSLTGGGAAREGWSVAYFRPFVGPLAAYQSALQAPALEPLQVLEQIVARGASPTPAQTPPSFEGIEKVAPGN